MRSKLFERRYWDVSGGKVRSVFSEKENSPTLNVLPASNNFFMWLDSKPFPFEFDMVLATSMADERRNAAESEKAAIAGQD